MMHLVKCLPWRKISVSVVAGVMLLLIGGSMRHLTSDWFGEGIGIGGVRNALADHESDASIHPNEELIQQRFKSLEEEVEDLKESVTKDVDRLEKAQEKNTDRILDALKNRSE